MERAGVTSQPDKMDSQSCLNAKLFAANGLSRLATQLDPPSLIVTNSPIGKAMRRRTRNHSTSTARGFTAVELLVTMAVGIIMAAYAVPLLQNGMNFFKVRAAASSVTGAIQSTRFQAIFHGCPYALAFNKPAMTYQVSNQLPGPAGCAAAFTNIGPAIPIANGSSVTLNQNVTFQFRPGGLTQTTLGVPTLVLDSHGSKETITVSTYGNITVTP